MKRTRAQFKLALRYCRNNKEVLESNALARSYLVDKRDFWKNVKKASKHKVTNNVCTINGVTGDAAIADMWKDSFEKLYSRYDNKGLTGEFVSVTSEDYHLIKADDVHNETQTEMSQEQWS